MSDTINPYNFIRTGKKVIRAPQSKGDLTGYLECTLKTKTPLIIPDSESVQIDKDHKTYDYFSYDEKDKKYRTPVIPGSEIRGAIRSKYEILTNSCLSALDEKVEFKGRSHCFFNYAGILENSNGKKVLWDAEINYVEFRFAKTSFKIDTGILTIDGIDYQMGSVIYFKSKPCVDPKTNIKRNYITEVSKSDRPDYKKGIVFTGESFGNKPQKKAIQHLKVLSKKQVELEGANDLWEEYFELVKEYKPNNKNRFSNINKDSKYIPVWYDKDETKRYYVSPSQNGRIKIKKSFLDIIDNDQQLLPCSSRKDGKACRACDLFGLTSDEGNITSRVRFGDAIVSVKNNNYSLGFITIRELAGPKVSNYLYYFDVFTPKRVLFEKYNVDFVVRNKRLTSAKKVGIKGRKEYWHHQYIQNQDKSKPGIPKSKINTTQNPLKPELEFKFKVYFNNIDEKTLKELIGSIQLNKDMAHKIGHAKPLGFGSVQIRVNNVVKRSVDIQNTNIYELNEENVPEDRIEDIFREYLTNEQIQDIEAMWTYKLIKNVNYLKVQEFGRNKATLPFASDAIKRNKGNNNGNNSNFRR